MSEEKSSASPAERVKASYKSLTAVASTLNSASDRLAKSVAELDAFLKQIALGVSSFVTFRSAPYPDPLQFDIDELGYAKNSGKWGLTIRTRSGHEAFDVEHSEQWPFNEAPRLLRVRAAKAIPELLEKLVADADEMSKEVEQRTGEVDAITRALTEAAAQGRSEFIQGSARLKTTVACDHDHDADVTLLIPAAIGSGKTSFVMGQFKKGGRTTK